MRGSETLLCVLALFTVPPAACGDRCGDISVSVLEPPPGSTLSSRDFYLKVGLAVTAATSLESILFRVQFDERTYNLNSIYDFEQLELHAATGLPVHTLHISAYCAVNLLFD